MVINFFLMMLLKWSENGRWGYVVLLRVESLECKIENVECKIENVVYRYREIQGSQSAAAEQLIIRNYKV